MFTATAYDHGVEVRVSDPRDRQYLHQIPRQDRSFDRTKGVWVVKNPEKYTSLPAIAVALGERRYQLVLPLEVL